MLELALQCDKALRARGRNLTNTTALEIDSNFDTFVNEIEFEFEFECHPRVLWALSNCISHEVWSFYVLPFLR